MKVIIFFIVFIFVEIGMIRSIGNYILVELDKSIIILAIIGVIGFTLFIKETIKPLHIVAVLVFFALFIYSITTSPYPGISLVYSFFALASSILYVTLVHADNNQGFTASPRKSVAENFSMIDIAKLAFIACASLHALALTLFYLFNPERTSGLMDDFSQASMLLLIAYGMAYPLIKDKIYFSGFSLLIFIGYFTTFSRTANFLLVFFFAALLFYELKNKKHNDVLKLIFIALIGFIFVQLYPSLIGEETVTRGGLAHFSTLNSRTIYWQTAWDAIMLKPIIGHGLGTYAWSGIQLAKPFNIIYFVHNDYLQIWHDLGIIWLFIFIGTGMFLLVKYSPIKLNSNSAFSASLNSHDSRKFTSWILLLSIALYMSINFLITNLEFQVAIAILLADLQRK